MRGKKNPAFLVTRYPAKLKQYPRDLYRLTSVKSVAQRTDFSVSRLRRLLRAEEVSGDKVGRLWLTSIAAVREYQQNNGPH